MAQVTEWMHDRQRHRQWRRLFGKSLDLCCAGIDSGSRRPRLPREVLRDLLFEALVESRFHLRLLGWYTEQLGQTSARLLRYEGF